VFSRQGLGELLKMLKNREKNRASVQIVLADNDSYMRQGLRNAFASEGYQNVRTIGKISMLKDVLNAAMPDLLIVDVGTPDGDAIALIKEIRAGKVGKNPFLPVILATWDSNPEIIGQAAQSGVDLIVTKPLSPAQLFTRIDNLVRDRKPFIATNRYFGPERRSKERQGSIRQFDVPNTLKDKLEGRSVDPVALGEQCGALMDEMQNSRLETTAVILAEKVEEVCTACEKGEALKNIDRALATISRTADDIRRVGKGDITALSASLVRIAGPLLRGDQEIGEQEVELMRPLSQSILLAARPNSDDPAVMAEISKAVARFAPKRKEPAQEPRTAPQARKMQAGAMQAQMA
jgi:DNA-binding response OmpR family regulator